ncbi:hypothetical protein HY374_03470 [Candidatus Berkelbacteria bacterium]|nr:hypothetical protein [Candidatus Berkelbacteria bacterium]
MAVQAQKKRSSTQAYLDIAAIKDGIVILENGGMRAILLVTSVNFALKSPEEQEDIVLRYQGFLNSLHSPLQIVMQSRKLDLTDYLAKLRTQAEGETNEAIRTQTTSYVAFMERLISVANIMDKRFYVVVPFDPDNLRARGFIDRLLHPAKQITVTMTEQEFANYKAQLAERVNLIASGLAAMGLKSVQLTTQQLIELYYATYNPEEAVHERLAGAEELLSGVVHSENSQQSVATSQSASPNGQTPDLSAGEAGASPPVSNQNPGSQTPVGQA